MTTDKTIEQMNEALAIFDGWEKVTVGYYGQHTGEEDDETPWQVENRAWLDQMEIESVGAYWVKVKENKVYDGHEIKYHEDWNQLHIVWNKLWYDCSIVPMKHELEWSKIRGSKCARAILYGNIKEAHKEIYEAIVFYTTTKQKD